MCSLRGHDNRNITPTKGESLCAPKPTEPKDQVTESGAEKEGAEPIVFGIKIPVFEMIVDPVNMVT